MKKNIFKNKKVLITGHTGFKGSWLSIWMHSLGANVLGISKNIPTYPSHYQLTGLDKIIKSKQLDLKDKKKLKKIIKDFKPDFIFHLAAQAIVKNSYVNPINTWESNLNGTIHLLESIKDIKKKIVVILITSDKVYKNLEIKRGYSENDLLGGIDPYGASKSATEIAIKSYIKSYFRNRRNKVLIAVARAGNVIGGGDWSENRLVPDCMKAWLKNKEVLIRNSNSTRPWQHVLEVLSGYISLAYKLNFNQKIHGQAFNFGPKNKNYKVSEILKKIKKIWPLVKWKNYSEKKFFENKLLNLNSKKSFKILKWRSKLSINDTIKMTVDWYKNYYINKKNKKLILKKSLNQINFYTNLK